MKVLVTGGAGFIGSHIVDKLVQEAHTVFIIDNLSTGKMENVNRKAILYKMDIRDNELVNLVYQLKPEVVIHTAAQINIQNSFDRPVINASVNIIGTVNLLEACRKSNVKKIIYSSSAAVYGTPRYLPVSENHQTIPISYYGISKHTPEHYFTVYNELYGLKYTILRYSNVYGVRQDQKGEGDVVSIFLNRILNEERPTIFGGGTQTRDFIYIEDVADANIAAMTYWDNNIVNISTNIATSINTLYKTMNGIVMSGLKPEYKEMRKGDILHSCLDNTKAIATSQWKPKYSLEKGLKRTINYYFEKKIMMQMNVS